MEIIQTEKNSWADFCVWFDCKEHLQELQNLYCLWEFAFSSEFLIWPCLPVGKECEDFSSTVFISNPRQDTGLNPIFIYFILLFYLYLFPVFIIVSISTSSRTILIIMWIKANKSGTDDTSKLHTLLRKELKITWKWNILKQHLFFDFEVMLRSVYTP